MFPFGIRTVTSSGGNSRHPTATRLQHLPDPRHPLHTHNAHSRAIPHSPGHRTYVPCALGARFDVDDHTNPRAEPSADSFFVLAAQTHCLGVVALVLVALVKMLLVFLVVLVALPLLLLLLSCGQTVCVSR